MDLALTEFTAEYAECADKSNVFTATSAIFAVKSTKKWSGKGGELERDWKPTFKPFLLPIDRVRV